MSVITELFCTYMDPLCRVPRGKTGEGDSGKTDYRHLKQGLVGGSWFTYWIWANLC